MSENDKEIVDAFLELFDQIDFTYEEVGEGLKEFDYKIENLGTEIRKQIRQVQSTTPLDWRNKIKLRSMKQTQNMKK